MRKHPGTFTVECCAKRRGVLPGGVLVCCRCDYKIEDATVIPNENKARDVPNGQRVWSVPPLA